MPSLLSMAEEGFPVTEPYKVSKVEVGGNKTQAI